MNEYDMTWDEMTLYSIALQHITLHDICMYIYIHLCISLKIQLPSYLFLNTFPIPKLAVKTSEV